MRRNADFSELFSIIGQERLDVLVKMLDVNVDETREGYRDSKASQSCIQYIDGCDGKDE